MVRALWSGAISFGLVNIPVKLVSATKDRDLHFNMLHAKDGARVKFQRTCAAEGKELANEEIVKGFDLGGGQYVTLTDEELEGADPEAARTIDIADFVELSAIDPSYYDKTYYLVPDKNADKAYGLLHAALDKSKKVGIARFVMRDKEYLAALRSKGKALVLETMHFAEEMVPESSIADDLRSKAPDEKQLAMAQQLIESLTLPFDPERYENTHRSRLRALIDQKAAGHEVVVAPAAKPAGQTGDLLAALEASLQKARQRPLAKGRKGGDDAKQSAKESAKEHVAKAKKRAKAAA